MAEEKRRVRTYPVRCDHCGNICKARPDDKGYITVKCRVCHKITVEKTRGRRGTYIAIYDSEEDMRKDAENLKQWGHGPEDKNN